MNGKSGRGSTSGGSDGGGARIDCWCGETGREGVGIEGIVGEPSSLIITVLFSRGWETVDEPSADGPNFGSSANSGAEGVSKGAGGISQIEGGELEGFVTLLWTRPGRRTMGPRVVSSAKVIKRFPLNHHY